MSILRKLVHRLKRHFDRLRRRSNTSERGNQVVVSDMWRFLRLSRDKIYLCLCVHNKIGRTKGCFGELSSRTFQAWHLFELKTIYDSQVFVAADRFFNPIILKLPY